MPKARIEQLRAAIVEHAQLNPICYVDGYTRPVSARTMVCQRHQDKARDTAVEEWTDLTRQRETQR